jgi:hypothetical protein
MVGPGFRDRAARLDLLVADFSDVKLKDFVRVVRLHAADETPKQVDTAFVDLGGLRIYYHLVLRSGHVVLPAGHLDPLEILQVKTVYRRRTQRRVLFSTENVQIAVQQSCRVAVVFFLTVPTQSSIGILDVNLGPAEIVGHWTRDVEDPHIADHAERRIVASDEVEPGVTRCYLLL